ncbi:MAG: HAD-IA family hydrolase, partial [Flavobacteriales bacterium]|nr:HAD-IA family hydrolase [Flavobacteriales bacterium]
IESIYPQLVKANFFEEFEIGAISTSEFIAQFQQFDNQITDDSILKAWNSMLLDIPTERLELISRLKKTHQVFLLSNTNDIHYNYINDYVKHKFQVKDFDEYFHKIYLSHQLKLRKPNPEIFKYVLENAQLQANETLFIDDSLEHINAAKNLGIKTHHLNLNQNQSLTQLFHEY